MLSFHLPYYALTRTAPTPSRRCQNGSLTKSIRIPTKEMSSRPSSRIDMPSDHLWLHETQLSCIVEGVDEYIWTAYCFRNSRIDSDRILPISREFKSRHSHPDLLAVGQFVREPVPKTPREYFLKLLQVRLELICEEWESIVSKLDKVNYRHIRIGVVFILTH